MFLVFKTLGVGVLSAAVWLTAEVNFSNTISTGVIISTVIVVAVAGLFTIKSHSGKIWHDSYDAEKALREERDKMLVALQEQMAQEREEQREIRHAMKTEIATLNLKTDLSGHEALAAERHLKTVEAIGALQTSIVRANENQTTVLQEIVTVLREPRQV